MLRCLFSEVTADSGHTECSHRLREMLAIMEHSLTTTFSICLDSTKCLDRHPSKKTRKFYWNKNNSILIMCWIALFQWILSCLHYNLKTHKQTNKPDRNLLPYIIICYYSQWMIMHFSSLFACSKVIEASVAFCTQHKKAHKDTALGRKDCGLPQALIQRGAEQAQPLLKLRHALGD